MLGIQWNAVILRSNERIGADDDIRQIRSGLGPFTVHDKILAATERGGVVTIGMETPSVSVERISIVDLLVERYARVGEEEQQRATGWSIFAGHDVVDIV